MATETGAAVYTAPYLVGDYPDEELLELIDALDCVKNLIDDYGCVPSVFEQSGEEFVCFRDHLQDLLKRVGQWETLGWGGTPLAAARGCAVVQALLASILSPIGHYFDLLFVGAKSHDIKQAEQRTDTAFHQLVRHRRFIEKLSASLYRIGPEQPRSPSATHGELADLLLTAPTDEHLYTAPARSGPSPVERADPPAPPVLADPSPEPRSARPSRSVAALPRVNPMITLPSLRHPANARTLAHYTNAGTAIMSISEEVSLFVALQASGRATAESYRQFAYSMLYSHGSGAALRLQGLTPEHQRRVSKLLALLWPPLQRIEEAAEGRVDAVAFLAIASGAFSEVREQLRELKDLSADLFIEARAIAAAAEPNPGAGTAASGATALPPAPLATSDSAAESAPDPWAHLSKVIEGARMRGAQKRIAVALATSRGKLFIPDAGSHGGTDDPVSVFKEVKRKLTKALPQWAFFQHDNHFHAQPPGDGVKKADRCS
jgi:hypothetical protein